MQSSAQMKFLLSIVLLLVTQQASTPKEFAHYTIVKFPRRSIGTCCLVDPGKKFPRTSSNFEARGTIKVPEGQGIGLKINYELSDSEDFAPLKEIDPNLFMQFDANEFPLTDKQLSLLAKMPNIYLLKLARTDLTDSGVEYLKGMKHLKSLDMRCTLVTSKGVSKACRYFPELVNLNLAKNTLDDTCIPAISKLKFLHSLNLSSCNQRGNHLELLAGLGNLTGLDLCNNKISDRQIKKLAGVKSLEELDLMDNPITYTGLKELKPLKNLKKITLRLKQFSNVDMKQLRTACLPPNCKVRDGSREDEIPSEVFAPLHSPFNRGDGIDKR